MFIVLLKLMNYMKKISVIESWGVAWGVFKKNWLIVLYAAFVPALISFLLEIISKKAVTWLDAGVIVLVLGTLYFVLRFFFSMLLNLGTLRIQLGVMNGNKMKYSDLFNPKGLYWKFIGGTILYSLVVLGGLILLIIPGIYFAIRYLFVPYLIIDKNMNIGDAFAKSTEMTNGKKWSILAFLIVTIIFSLLGLIVLFVGVVFTSAIAYLAIIHMYQTLLNEGVGDKNEAKTVQQEDVVQPVSTESNNIAQEDGQMAVENSN